MQGGNHNKNSSMGLPFIRIKYLNDNIYNFDQSILNLNKDLHIRRYKF